jgi:hypothetical protein
MAALRALLLAALVAAVGFGVGIGTGAAIWEGSSSSPAAASATSWLFVATAESGAITATGGEALTIIMRGTAPISLAFTNRPALEAKGLPTASLQSVFDSNVAGFGTDGSAPPNGALSFAYEGAAVILPVEILNFTGVAPDYTVTARALGAGDVALAVQGGVAVYGTNNPLWEALQAGLEVAAPSFFIDDFET